jgi:plasmid stabilization system protein ParE
MKAAYVLASEAAVDLVEIWRYVWGQSSVATADRIEAEILDKAIFLSRTPNAGHVREDLTNEQVRFFAVYSYLIVYRPETKPLQIVSILHGRQDLERILKERL